MAREKPAPRQQDTLSLFEPERAERRSNKVVNIHTTTQLQVVLVKPDRFENAAEIAKVAQDLNDLKADLPLIYVTREDFIRVSNNIDNKLDRLLYRSERKEE